MPQVFSSIILISIISSLCVEAKINSWHGRQQKKEAHYKLDYNTILGAIGTPDCVRKCIDPFMREVAGLWDLNDITGRAEKLCTEHKKALSCIKSQLMCDEKGGFAMASRSMETLCARQRLFESVKPCLKRHLPNITRTCDTKCDIRRGVDKFTNYQDIQLVSKLGGNVFTVSDHLGEVCSFVRCGVQCLTTGIQSKCGQVTGFLAMEVIMAPFEGIAQVVQDMVPGMRLLIAGKLDKRCHFFMSPSQVARLRNFDFSAFNYEYKL